VEKEGKISITFFNASYNILINDNNHKDEWHSKTVHISQENLKQSKIGELLLINITTSIDSFLAIKNLKSKCIFINVYLMQLNYSISTN